MTVVYVGEIDNPMAVLIRSNERVDGINFFTPGHFSQQLGLMSRSTGYVVPAHTHNLVERKITQTQEVLLLRIGRIRVTIYDENSAAISEIDMYPGDVILLAHGGHKIEVLEDAEILEVKQGPYAGPNDKTHFTEK